MEASIIIAYHNEGQAFITETVKQIRETADIADYEIIIVDDHSNRKIVVDGAKVIRHARRHGVGKAFDTGAYYAKSDILILMGSDIRFMANGWMSKLVQAAEENPKSLVCTSCVVLSADKPRGLDMEYRRTVNVRSGASLLAYQNPGNMKGLHKTKSILSAQWLPKDPKTTGIIEVPVILGAIYSVKKEWYQYIDGFAGHRLWGTLEPLISIKSYMFGGNCLCHKGVETGHIFRTKSTHNISQEIVYYNKIMAASMLFEKPLRKSLIAYIPVTARVASANKMIDHAYAQRKHEQYRAKAVMSGAETLARMKASMTK